MRESIYTEKPTIEQIRFNIICNLTFKKKINLRFSSFKVFAKVFLSYKTLALEAVPREIPMNSFIFSNHRYLWSTKFLLGVMCISDQRRKGPYLQGTYREWRRRNTKRNH